MEKVAVRFVSGGVVNGASYPDAGEPDWKAEARRLLEANREAVRKEAWAAFRDLVATRLKAAEEMATTSKTKKFDDGYRFALRHLLDGLEAQNGK